MKAEVFAKPEVRRELGRFVFVELYTEKPENAKLMEERFKSENLPLYVLLNPDGKELARLNEGEFDIAKFIAFLRKAAGDLRVFAFRPITEKVRAGDVARFDLDVEGAIEKVTLDGPFENVAVKGREVSARVKPDAPAGKLVVRGKLNDKLDLSATIEISRPDVKIVSVEADRASVQSGGRFTLRLKLAVDPPTEWAKVPKTAKILLDEPFKAGAVKESGNDLSTLVVAGGTGHVEIRGKLIVTISDGKEKLERTVEFKLPMTVTAPVGEAPKQADVRSKGIMAFLGLCIVGGLISLIMPCVYPLLPITMTFFLKQSSQGRSAAGLSLLYGLGIIVTFTGLGFGLSLLLGASGAQVFAANPWVNLAIAALFFALAVSLLGMFELKLPGFITDRATGSGPKQGYMGAFGLGLIFSVVTFTCTIPIAASLMALAATGARTWAFLGMLTYSVTMAIPFFMLGFFPALIKKIPKSGGWLHTVKVGAGFLELALAFYYLAKADFSLGINLLGRELVLAIWVAVMLLAASWLLGFWRFKEDEKHEHVGYGRAMWAFLFATFSFWLMSGLVGRHLGGFEAILPIGKTETVAKPPTDGGGPAPAEPTKVYEDLEEALAVADKTGRPVFLEFTGFT